MMDRTSKPGRRACRAPRPWLRAPAAALVLAVLYGGGPAAPAQAAGEATPAQKAAQPSPMTKLEERILGREALIGKLIPITGEPLETRSADLRVEFRINSAALTAGAELQLQELGWALVSVALRHAAIGVYGHTDESGPAHHNQALSERRAQTVATFLQEFFDIAEERFREVRGYGEERLRDDLPPDAPAQRRVEIVIFHENAIDGAVDATARTPAPEATDDAQGTTTPVRVGDGVTISGDAGAAEQASDEDQGAGEGTDGVIVIQ